MFPKESVIWWSILYQSHCSIQPVQMTFNRSEATKHDTNSIPVTFSTRSDPEASESSPSANKWWDVSLAWRSAEPHLLYQQYQHSTRLHLSVCFTLQPHFPHSYVLCFDRLITPEQSHNAASKLRTLSMWSEHNKSMSDEVVHVDVVTLI